MSSTVGRYAPSPSGRMHLGNLCCCLLAWLSAKSSGGKVVLRIEDLDAVRCPREFADLLEADLAWLGLAADEGGSKGGPRGPYYQSERSAIYEEYYQKLVRKGLVYPCFCSRSQLHAADAPHRSDGKVVYAGTCRNLTPEEIVLRTARRKPAWRVMVPDETISFVDGHMGPYAENLAQDCGDFYLRRADGVFAYQLAVVKPAQSLAGQTYACTAIVQPDAETSWQPGNVRATLLITRLDGRKTSLKVYCTDLPYSEAGDIITGQFQLQPLRADSYRMSRYAKGTWLGASYQADYIWQGTSDALPYRLYHLRQAFAKRLTTYLPQNLAGVEAAMLLGEKSELTDEWSDTFRTAGIAHLLAVSGLHVALLCGLFAMGQGRRSRFSVPRVLLQITVLLLYMGLTGLPFSVFRAGVMFLIMLVGSLLLQPPDSLTALALAAIIIGVQQPFAPCDIGFQLSVCGVLGVLAASALAKRQTQFVQVRYAARHNQRRQTALPLPLAIVLRAVDAVQTAVLATLATLPVLLLHGMAASGAAVPANLLVAWLLGPALRLGILALVLSFVPVLDPLFHGASLLLGIVLRLMTTLAAWCAALPAAHIALPVRYTLWVLAVFAVLAALFWRTRQLRRFVPVGFVCAVAAVMLGGTMQRDVVRLAMVGTAGNGCVVAVQNNRAVVLYRGSAANGRAVQQYLTQNGAPELAAVIDLRTEPGEMPLQAAQLLTIADLPQGLTHLQLLDTVEVDLLHTNAAALAVLDVGGWHAAASAGKLILADPVAVDLYCAGGSCPEAIQAKAILCNQQTPKWLSKAGDTPVYYDAETPTAVVRPGKSVVYEEVQPLAVQ